MVKKKVDLGDINKKLNLIIKNQNQLLKISKEIDKKEGKELTELEKLKKFEQEIKKEVGKHPLRKITIRDIAKGTVGAFVGVAAHYTFYYGVRVAQQIDMTRAIIIFILSYLVGAVFLYMTGYRKIKIKMVSFLPMRLSVLYATAVVTAFLLLFLFEPNFLATFEGAFKQLATVTLSATIGACTADLIGRGE